MPQPPTGCERRQDDVLKEGRRSSPEDEIEGLGLPEIGRPVHPEFRGSHLPGPVTPLVPDPAGTALGR